MIYVDELRVWPSYVVKAYAKKRPGAKNLWCWMVVSDEGTIEQLHAMARKIGVGTNYFVDDSAMPHYDLLPMRRMMALQEGAVETNSEFIEEMRSARCRRLQEDA